jgi:hypothetical protein
VMSPKAFRGTVVVNGVFAASLAGGLFARFVMFPKALRVALPKTLLPPCTVLTPGSLFSRSSERNPEECPKLFSSCTGRSNIFFAQNGSETVVSQQQDICLSFVSSIFPADGKHPGIHMFRPDNVQLAYFCLARWLARDVQKYCQIVRDNADRLSGLAQ